MYMLFEAHVSTHDDVPVTYWRPIPQPAYAALIHDDAVKSNVLPVGHALLDVADVLHCWLDVSVNGASQLYTAGADTPVAQLHVEHPLTDVNSMFVLAYSDPCTLTRLDANMPPDTTSPSEQYTALSWDAKLDGRYMSRPTTTDPAVTDVITNRDDENADVPNASFSTDTNVSTKCEPSNVSVVRGAERP